MPRGDHTGPEGQGPRTGRGAGHCGGADSPGDVQRGPGFGRGRCRGRGGGGRGWRHQFRATGKTGRERAPSDSPSTAGPGPTRSGVPEPAGPGPA